MWYLFRQFSPPQTRYAPLLSSPLLSAPLLSYIRITLPGHTILFDHPLGYSLVMELLPALAAATINCALFTYSWFILEPG